MSKIIKRYGNRKLYDTDLSRYVTLDEIYHMIKDGDEIQVIDNKTREDLTSVTLTQIILEEEKRKKSILPLSVLTKLIQQSGESISDFLQRSVDSFSSVFDESERQIQRLITRGEITVEEGQAFLKDTFANPQKGFDALQKKIDERIKISVNRVIGFEKLKTELKKLEGRIKRMEKKIRELE